MFLLGFKVLRQADLSQRLQGVDKMAAVVEDFPFWAYVGLGQAPTHVAVSADDHTLAVCIIKGGCPFALMYDVRAFANKVKVHVPTVFKIFFLNKSRLK